MDRQIHTETMRERDRQRHRDTETETQTDGENAHNAIPSITTRMILHQNEQ